MEGVTDDCADLERLKGRLCLAAGSVDTMMARRMVGRSEGGHSKRRGGRRSVEMVECDVPITVQGSGGTIVDSVFPLKDTSHFPPVSQVYQISRLRPSTSVLGSDRNRS